MENKDGLKNRCKACDKIARANWYQKNREAEKQKAKAYAQANPAIRKKNWQKYYAKNKEKRKQYNKDWRNANPGYKQEYRDANRGHINARDSKRNRERYASDTIYKLKCLLRARLRAALDGKSKAESTLKLLGCALPVLKEHMEAQFTNEMSWENLGNFWHIDHIVPFAAFDLANHIEQRVVCWYKNLQPLPGVDNLTKGAKYREEDKEDLIRRYNEKN